MEPNDIACLEEARKLLDFAYAPYSHFHVSALIVGASGNLYRGVNVENASYGLTICAERVAIGAAITAGEKEIVCVYVMTPTSVPTSPCGACRQVIREFGKKIRIVMGTVSGQVQIVSLEELLPLSFGPENLEKNF